MKEKNTKPVATVVPKELAAETTRFAKVISIASRYEVAKQKPQHVTEDKSRVIKRFSFDDNGGGYEGL